MRDFVAIPGSLVVDLYERGLSEDLLDRLRPYAELAKKPRYHFEGRVWWRSPRSGGGGFHSCRVYENGELVFNSGEHSGGGDQYLQTGVAWLREHRVIDNAVRGITLDITSKLFSTYECREVPRERDL